MRLEKYLKRYGTEYEDHLRAMVKSDKVLMAGMLQFNDETSSLWSKPFPGGFAHYLVEDHSNSPNLTHIDHNDRDAMSYPTIECPYVIRVSGTDDTSYSLCYVSFTSAAAGLMYLMESQPIDFNTEFLPMGFGFTN